VPSKFNPFGISVIPLPCVEAAMDAMAAAAELSLAEALAKSPAEKRAVERAGAALDLAALRAGRWPEFLASVARMERALRAFEPRAKALTVHVIGHTHIDMDWQWTWKDTVYCIRRDFRATLGVLDDYPDVKFSMSQIPTYDVVRRRDPGLFRQVRARIAEGRWENLASTWVEGDLNMADGESIARHLLYAADWSQKHLGRKATVFWAPDTFGHPGNMPQLAALGECDTYFHWRCNPGGWDNWPARLWEGMDGTRIPAISSAYGAGSLLAGPHMYMLHHNLLQAVQFGLKTSHHVWGLGDHGGGLPRHQLALFERYRHRPLMPRFVFSTLAELRAALLKERARLPRNRGETYPLFEGCYTTHADIKALNRRCESVLLTAESMAAAGGLDRRAALRAAWTPVLFTQFHDIFDGCAVPDSYRDAHRRGARALGAAWRVVRAAQGKLGRPSAAGRTLRLFNPLGFGRCDAVEAELPAGTAALRVAGGAELPVQRVGRAAVFVAASVPALGCADFRPVRKAKRTPPSVVVTEDARHFTIETEHARCKLSKAAGVIGSYFDKRLDRELVGYGVPKMLQHAEGARHDLALNVFELEEEAPGRMAAWLAHDFRRVERLLSGAKVRRLETGPVCARFEVRHRVRSSRIVEEIRFYRERPRVEFRVRLDWREKGSETAGVPRLSVGFAAALRAPRVYSEGPYTVRETPADGLERPTQKWVDVVGDEFGYAVFNDGRYGFDALGGRVRMALVRGSFYPDPDSDRGVHEVRFAFEPHAARFDPAWLVREGLAFNRPAMAWRTSDRPRTHASGVQVESRGAVVCTAVRVAEHSGGLLVRLFECAGRRARARVTVRGGLRRATPVNFLENPLAPALKPVRGWVDVALRPFEVKTLRVG
jgi:alpha-mannosidase